MVRVERVKGMGPVECPLHNLGEDRAETQNLAADYLEKVFALPREATRHKEEFRTLAWPDRKGRLPPANSSPDLVPHRPPTGSKGAFRRENPPDGIGSRNWRSYGPFT